MVNGMIHTIETLKNGVLFANGYVNSEKGKFLKCTQAKFRRGSVIIFFDSGKKYITAMIENGEIIGIYQCK